MRKSNWKGGEWLSWRGEGGATSTHPQALLEKRKFLLSCLSLRPEAQLLLRDQEIEIPPCYQAQKLMFKAFVLLYGCLSPTPLSTSKITTSRGQGTETQFPGWQEQRSVPENETMAPGGVSPSTPSCNGLGPISGNGIVGRRRQTCSLHPWHCCLGTQCRHKTQE